jgi:hypothetical protein
MYSDWLLKLIFQFFVLFCFVFPFISFFCFPLASYLSLTDPGFSLYNSFTHFTDIQIFPPVQCFVFLRGLAVASSVFGVNSVFAFAKSLPG